MLRHTSSIKRPSPPPSVRPAMPTVGHPPDVVASPKRRVAVSRSRTRAPASARATRLPVSTSTPFIAERSITTPPSHIPNPRRLWPPARTARDKCLVWANSRVRATSEGPAQRTITAGCRSNARLKIERAALATDPEVTPRNKFSTTRAKSASRRSPLISSKRPFLVLILFSYV